MSIAIREPAAENDGRAASTDQSDLRPATATARVLLRYAPFVILLTVLAAGGMGVFAKATESSRSARARVVLTNRVVWPYYDSTRDAQAELVLQQETFDEVARRIADVGTLEKLTTDVPTAQAFLDVVATASSADAAIAAANAAADYLTEHSREAVGAETKARLDGAQKDLASLDASIKTIEGQLAAIEPRIAALSVAIAVPNPTADNIAQIRLLENQRALLLEQRGNEMSRRNQAQVIADAATVDLRDDRGQVDVLRRAYRTATDPGRTRGLILLAGAVAAIIGTLGALGFDAAYQRIRSRRHASAGAARGLVVIDPEELGSDIAYVNRLLEQRSGREIVGVASAYTSATASTRAVSAIAGVLSHAHASVVTLGEANTAPGNALQVPLRRFLEGTDDEVELAHRELLAGLVDKGHVHVELDGQLSRGGVVSHSNRFDRLLATARDHADVVLLDCGLTSDASVRWRSLGGSCNVVLVLIDPRRTRQSTLRRAVQAVRERRARQTVVSIGIPHVVVSQTRSITAPAT